MVFKMWHPLAFLLPRVQLLMPVELYLVVMVQVGLMLPLLHFVLVVLGLLLLFLLGLLVSEVLLVFVRVVAGYRRRARRSTRLRCADALRSFRARRVRFCVR